ncbi:hypothetical protein KEJ34_01185 [Candidatus Bathyarchaeota archaeon]|nr:hypothetical protein [Candidatus Bathyarchaeota archaeon]
MSERKFVSRKIAIALGIVCIVLLVLLVGNIYTLSSRISSLNSQLESLENENSSLKSEKSTKDDIISSLNSQVASLNSQIAELRNQRDKLQTWLQGNITYYNSQMNSLNSQVVNLQNKISSLNSQISILQDYVSAYQSLREKVNHRWNQISVEPFITPRDQAVIEIVYSITGGWSNPSDFDECWKDIKTMYNWVVNNIEYRYDGLYPILPYEPSGDLSFWDEMWQFPNETLNLKKGDCEDMAILLCSMIRCYEEQCSAEVITIRSSLSGHSAVQILVKDYKLIILDPVGKYYSCDYWGNIVFNDITAEINNWLNYWKPAMGSDVYVWRIFSDHIDKKFISTREYIAWMYSR